MKEWIRDIAIAVIIAIIVIQFIKPTIVKESSMEPNFYENDYLLLSKQAYTFGEPERGDVIVFESNLKTDSGSDKLLIKRVIAIPGDKITIKDGEVYINDKKQNSDYTMDGYTNGDINNMEVPKNKLFCMGDNRLVSIDSRDPSVGMVDMDTVVGQVFFRIYPFNKIGTIK